MGCNRIDTSVYCSFHFAGGTVGIFIIYHNKRKKTVPQISFKTVAHCQFNQLVQTSIIQFYYIRPIIKFTIIVFQNPCKIIK